MSFGNVPSSSIRFVGWTRSEIDTPCLCLDLTAFESNLSRVASSVSAAKKHWRPHAKCHKSPEIALRCLAQGAIGVTCAKISEAEVFAAAGITDLLIAHLPVGPGRVRRLAELCRVSNPIVTCDHYVQAAELSAECARPESHLPNAGRNQYRPESNRSASRSRCTGIGSRNRTPSRPEAGWNHGL